MSSPADSVRFLASVLLGAALVATGHAAGAEPTAASDSTTVGAPRATSTAPRVVFSASVGLVRPGDGVVRDLYGGGQLAFGVDCEVLVGGPFETFAGARFATADGTTAVVESPAFEESYDIELATRSFHAGGALVRGLGDRARLFGGAGLAVGWYEERWPALGEPVSGTSLGLVALGGLHYALDSRFGLVARAEFSWLQARDASEDERKVNLGGLGFSLGASVRF